MLNGSCLCQSVKWSFEGKIDALTACNCTACRRYGALWTYGHEGEEIRVQGETTAFARGNKKLSFHFCPQCGCVAYWRANSVGENGKRRIAVNVRTANNPEEIFSLPIDHFDGFEKWEDLPSDGKCVRDIWF